MRFLVFLLVVTFGCVATLPQDNTLSADIACETARMVVQLRQEMAPTPASDLCDNCGGTGTLGDQRITVKCPACNGTGKKQRSECKDCK